MIGEQPHGVEDLAEAPFNALEKFPTFGRSPGRFRSPDFVMYYFKSRTTRDYARSACAKSRRVQSIQYRSGNLNVRGNGGFYVLAGPLPRSGKVPKVDERSPLPRIFRGVNHRGRST